MSSCQNRSQRESLGEEDPLQVFLRELSRWWVLGCQTLTVERELWRLRVQRAVCSVALRCLGVFVTLVVFSIGIVLFLLGLAEMISALSNQAEWFGNLVVGASICAASFVGGFTFFTRYQRAERRRLEGICESAERNP